MSKPSRSSDSVGRSATVVREVHLKGTSVLQVEGPLRVPLSAELRFRVQALLLRGERTILLNLARVSAVDAAGLGELVRAYNMTVAARGLLRVTETTERVRELLERVGLFDLLTSSNGRIARINESFRPRAQRASGLMKLCPSHSCESPTSTASR